MDDAEGLHDRLRLDADAGLLVDSLSRAELRRLADLLDRARAAEADGVSTAVDEMLTDIPSPIRGRVHGMLRGSAR